MFCLYYINKKEKKKTKKKINDFNEILTLEGFLMSSKKEGLKINNQLIKNLQIVNKKLAYPLVSKKVEKKYLKLISLLTELLISDDEEGTTFREALNQIEKFRLEIKNKYRAYLKQKELEMMSKQLSSLQNEAKMRLFQIQESLYLERNNGKSR